jgi:transcription elongation factor Elf1
MIKPKHDMLYGQAIWDIYACEICGALVLPSTAKLHEDFHGKQPQAEVKTAIKDCKVCGKAIEMPLDADGAMILDKYDDHVESHNNVN